MGGKEIVLQQEVFVQMHIVDLAGFSDGFQAQRICSAAGPDSSEVSHRIIEFFLVGEGIAL